jgi:N-acyl-phosphatidylethanolamine-hydrolysing phospholipase D
MSPVHMNPADAVQAYIDLKADIFIPSHWGTFNLADEPMDEPPQKLREEIRKLGLDSTKFWIMQHGEYRLFDKENEIVSGKVSQENYPNKLNPKARIDK